MGCVWVRARMAISVQLLVAVTASLHRMKPYDYPRPKPKPKPKPKPLTFAQNLTLGERRSVVVRVLVGDPNRCRRRAAGGWRT